MTQKIQKQKLSKVCLGTAQIGMNYGINNTSGKPSYDEAKRIIDYALKNGVTSFDTAPEYGESEKILGRCFSEIFAGKNPAEKEKSMAELAIISKIPPTDWTKSDAELKKSMGENLDKTLKSLGVKKIQFYLFHRYYDMKNKDCLLLKEALLLKKKGLAEKIGVSIYTPEEAEGALLTEGIEAIQVPFNLIDKRLIENGFFERAKKKDVTIFARSVYLQGLFFRKEIPAGLEDFSAYKKRIEKISNDSGIAVAELALRYAASIKEIDSILVGVELLGQLSDNLRIINKGALPKDVIKAIHVMGSAPEKIINPALWSSR